MIAVVGDLAKGIVPVYMFRQYFGNEDPWLAVVMFAAAHVGEPDGGGAAGTEN